MTTTNEYSTMIAVFVTRDQANQAIDNLRHTGYGYDQIRLVNQGANSFVENIKSLFTGQTMTKTDSADDWMRIGVPEQDAHQYQRELDADRSIVLIKSVNSPDQALNILRQSGAYDLAFRFRSEPPTMPAGAYQPNAQSGTYNPPVDQGPNMSTAQPGTYNPPVAQSPIIPTAQPGTSNREMPAGARTANMQPETSDPLQP
ncbi:MAG TPA: hypothetical protein VFQ36_16410 [Ktedonobacteraceae bacterium]|nr:hypothetical protein [Ktedonobacteraceae bacterium]HEU0002490.1 hypothetical protein [Ktedonobacteraceae bacterium]